MMRCNHSRLFQFKNMTTALSSFRKGTNLLSHQSSPSPPPSSCPHSPAWSPSSLPGMTRGTSPTWRQLRRRYWTLESWSLSHSFREPWKTPASLMIVRARKSFILSFSHCSTVCIAEYKPDSEFCCVLADAAVIDQIRGMSPSTIDKEFRSLSPEAGGHTHSERQLLCLLRALLHQLRSRREFELTQAYLGLALKVHLTLCHILNKSAALCKLSFVSASSGARSALTAECHG